MAQGANEFLKQTLYRPFKAAPWLGRTLGLKPQVSPVIPSSFVILNYGGQVGISPTRHFGTQTPLPTVDELQGNQCRPRRRGRF